jgi:hypothetical protein
MVKDYLIYIVRENEQYEVYLDGYKNPTIMVGEPQRVIDETMKILLDRTCPLFPKVAIEDILCEFNDKDKPYYLFRYFTRAKNRHKL